MSATTDLSRPSPYQLQRDATSLAEARERILAIDPTMLEDNKLWVDSLEGIAEGNPIKTIEGLIRSAIDAADLAALAMGRMKELAKRKEKFEKIEAEARDIARMLMESGGIPKLVREDFTASIRAGQPHVIPTLPPEEMPPRFQRVKIDHNKGALAEALRAGEADVPAEWSNPQPTLTIRER